MARAEVGFKGSKLVGAKVDAAQVEVAADTDTGVSEGSLQATIVALAARVKALEDAAA